MQNQAATQFTITYRRDYKVIEVASGPTWPHVLPAVATTYILHRCGSEQPSDQWIRDREAANASTMHFVEIPLTAVATGNSPVGCMLVRASLVGAL